MEVKKNVPLSGYYALLAHLALFLVALMCLFVPSLLGLALLLGITGIFFFWGYFAVTPGEAKILILFGSYKATVTANGFYWDWPVMRKETVSLKFRSVKTPVYHANDLMGMPTRLSLLAHWYPENPTVMVVQVEDPDAFIMHQLEASLKARVRSRQLVQTPQGAVFKDPELLSGVKDLANTKLRPNGLRLTDLQWVDCDFGPEVYERVARKKEESAQLAQRMENVPRIADLAAKMADSLVEKGLLSTDSKETFITQLIISMASRGNGV
jgi:regulator of protease activity HflC (stomatin/prohibitin superfamily)